MSEQHFSYLPPQSPTRIEDMVEFYPVRSHMSEQDEQDKQLLLEQAQVLLTNAQTMIEHPPSVKPWKADWLRQVKEWLAAYQLVMEQPHPFEKPEKPPELGGDT